MSKIEGENGQETPVIGQESQEPDKPTVAVDVPSADVHDENVPLTSQTTSKPLGRKQEAEERDDARDIKKSRLFKLPDFPPHTQHRSHEDNQERAFIAASHRADRSLAKRIASACKASRTHYQRTGKWFRITKEDVEGEEMYQEVDTLEEAGLIMLEFPKQESTSRRRSTRRAGRDG